MIACEGDGISGYNFNAKCYSSEACQGCSGCEIKCSPSCENCPDWSNKKLDRELEVGDYVYVDKKVASSFGGKLKWDKKMDQAVGRVAWIKSGGPRKGFILKFSPEVTAIEKFLFASASLRLATLEDVKTSDFIHTLKDQKED
jgi:hypothetical protein